MFVLKIKFRNKNCKNSFDSNDLIRINNKICFCWKENIQNYFIKYEADKKYHEVISHSF
jgi:hypothetical protein